MGFRVPDFFVVGSQTFEDHYAGVRGVVASKLRRIDGDAEIAELSNSIESELNGISLDEGLVEAINRATRRRFDGRPVMVRSSGTLEDGGQRSFAGVFESVLADGSATKVKDAIVSVLNSGFSARAIEYFHANRLPFDSLKLATIVQEYVAGDFSGITFTMDPVNFHTNRGVVTVIEGDCRALASGEDEGTTVLFDRDRPQLTAEDMDPGKTRIASLAVQQALTIESRQGGAPQDVEWTSQNGTIFVLQARPVSTWKERSEGDERLIWDNSNIVESFYGATTPLTYSFARRNYAEVYRNFYRSMGASHASIAKKRALFDNMIGFHRNNIYYNLNNWYGTLILMPGFKHNARYMESMMGVKTRLNLEIFREQERDLKHRLLFVPSLIHLIFKLVANGILLSRRVRRFLNAFDRFEAEFLEKEISAMDLSEVVSFYRRRESTFTGLWRVPVMNDLYTMLDYGRIHARLEGGSSEHGFRLSELLAGERATMGCEPALKLKEIVEEIRSSDELGVFFNDHDEHEVFERLSGVPLEPHLADLRRVLYDYIVDYGSRCIGDMKLEVESFIDRPDKLIGHIQYLLDRPPQPELPYQQRSGLPREWKSIGRRIVRLRKRLSQREVMRLKRSKVFRATRMIFLRIAEHMVEAGVLDDREQIFFLTEEEIFQSVEGWGSTKNLRSLVALRQKEFEENRTFTPPERFTTDKIDFHTIQRLDGEAVSVPEGNRRKGTGCSGGTVRARVVLYYPGIPLREVQDGILVTYRSDPGFVSFFLSINGLLVEKGSMLSHSAIVAREMRIPTIMNVPGLMQWLRDGDFVEIEATTGLITKLDAED